MKVVVQSDASIWGGNEKWLVLVATGLSERGHDVLVSCKRGGPVAERARAAGLRVTHARPGGDADIVRALGFALMLRRERPDVVLLSAFKRVFWGGWAARRAGVKRVVERLGIEHDLPPKWKYRHAFEHYVDALIVNSEVIRQRWLRSAPGFPAEEVHVVLNGVRPPEASGRTVREELGLPADVALIAGAGRLESRKGFDLLLEAFAEADPGARLAIAGDGDAEDDLRARAESLGIGDRVHWLGFRENLGDLLVDADVFVLPSRREGMANVMLEAMAAGCLIIGTDVSGVREALGPRGDRPEAGWIVPPDDAGAMAVALREALTTLGRDEVPPGAAAAGGAGALRPGAGATAAGLRREVTWRAKHWFAPERTVEHTERVLAGEERAR